MYSGTSSVPMISSGSKSRLKEEKKKHEARDHMENKEQIKKELTFESYASSMSCPPGVACPCPWPWGFFL
jgi:pterin-4a-carbinolamine dehydratase